jgi:hypothetical protein
MFQIENYCDGISMQPSFYNTEFNAKIFHYVLSLSEFIYAMIKGKIYSTDFAT